MPKKVYFSIVTALTTVTAAAVTTLSLLVPVLTPLFVGAGLLGLTITNVVTSWKVPDFEKAKKTPENLQNSKAVVEEFTNSKEIVNEDNYSFEEKTEKREEKLSTKDLIK